MRILTDNLRLALVTAIATRKAQDEKVMGGPSGLVQGWQQVLDAIQQGERIDVADKPIWDEQ